MGDHALVAPNLIKAMVEDVKKGKKGADELARHCGGRGLQPLPRGQAAQENGDDIRLWMMISLPIRETGSQRHCEGVERPKQSHKNLKSMRLTRSPAMAGSLTMTEKGCDAISRWGEGIRS